MENNLRLFLSFFFNPSIGSNQTGPALFFKKKKSCDLSVPILNESSLLMQFLWCQLEIRHLCERDSLVCGLLLHV